MLPADLESKVEIPVNTPRESKLTALFIFGLAVLFCAFFMHAKHDPALSDVNAFADDPYDAVGSFGIQAAVFLGVLCLIRAFRWDRAPREREASLRRAQTAALLSVAVTLAADAVAMLRHFSLWFGSPAGYRLVALLAGMAILTAVIGAPVIGAARKMGFPAAFSAWRNAAIVSLIAVITLLVYPENFRRGLIGAVVTAIVGTTILFALMWAWTVALVPYRGSVASEKPPVAARWFTRRKYQWAIVILAGVLIGLFLVAGEASEGTGIPSAKLALVVSVYIGLETIGVMIGYCFLRKPLGLFGSDLQ